MSTPAGLVDRLISVSSSIGFLEFDAKNEHFNYGYASAAAVIKRLNTELAKVGVLCTASEEVTHLEGSNAVVRCELTYHCGETGETLTCAGVGQGQDKGDKAVMKASTAAFKYAISHSKMLGWGAEDPENSASDASATGSRSAPSRGSSRKPVSAPRGRAKKSAEPSVGIDELMASIEAAASEEELTELTGSIFEYRAYDKDKYNELRAAHKARKEEVSE